MTPLRTLFRHSLAWPVLTLALLFALDVAHRPGFCRSRCSTATCSARRSTS